MHHPLAPCPSCARHVRATETRCPFCARAFGSELANGVVPGATQRLGRAASFVFTATVALAGCAAAVEPDGGGGQTDVAVVDTGPVDEGSTFPLYGAATGDTGVIVDAGPAD